MGMGMWRVGEEGGDRGQQSVLLAADGKDESSMKIQIDFPSSSKTPPYKRTLILVLVFLDLIGVGLIMPLLAPLVKDLGASPMQLGLLQSLYGVLQLISSPVMGLVSDRKGRRLVLLVSYLGTSFGYLLLGFSSSLQFLLISRLITGLLKHSVNAAKAYIADHTGRHDRAVDIGRLATASGLGVMVGPALGGLLFEAGGYALPGCLSGTLFMINSAIVATMLPRNELIESSLINKSEKKPKVGGWLHSHLPQLAILQRPRVLSLFLVRLIMGLGVLTFRQGFSILLLYKFNLSIQYNGYLISFQGLVSSLVQGFAIRPLVRRFEDEHLIFMAQVLLGVSFILCSLSHNVGILCAMLVPVALSSGIIRTTYTALLTTMVPQTEVGQVLGLADMVMASSRVVGPTIAGTLASQLGPSIPGIFSGCLVLVAAVVFAQIRSSPSNKAS